MKLSQPPQRIFLRCALLLAFLTGLAFGSDESALLEAIRKNPAEDTPRLIYADWLDEHGRGAQAEFIRAQVAFEPYSGDRNVPDDVVNRYRSAYDAGRAAILGSGVNELLEKNGVQVSFSRGFPLEVNMSGEAILSDKVIEALNALPFVSRLHIEPPGDMSGDVLARQLKRLKLLRRVPSVILGNTHLLNEKKFELLLDDLHAVTDLRLSGIRTSVHLETLASHTVAGQLKSLGLVSGGEGSLEALVRGARFAQLEALQLGFSPVNLTPLRDLTNLPHLQELNLHDSRPTSAQMEPFIRSKGFKQLRIFNGPLIPGNFPFQTLVDWIVSVDHNLVSVHVDAAGYHSRELQQQIQRNKAKYPSPICSLFLRALSTIAPYQ